MSLLNNYFKLAFFLILLSLCSHYEVVSNPVIIVPGSSFDVGSLERSCQNKTKKPSAIMTTEHEINSNVKNFGAKGDGVTDDTKSIISAIEGSSNGLVVFPRGSYRITRTIEIILSETGTLGLSGSGGSAKVIMDGEGPAFRFIGSHNGSSLPETVKEITWKKERMPTIANLEIVGSNPKADGLEFYHTISGNTIQAIPSPDGSNIRFTGPENNNQKIGLWSITGNHYRLSNYKSRIPGCPD